MTMPTFNRRRFLKQSSLLAMAPTVPGFLGQSLQAAQINNKGKILVVIQMSGGNDGINTVIPYADEGYAKHRTKLNIATDRVIKVDDEVGLHPAMRGMADLLEDGRLAIVQGVGYPNPNRSHDVSMNIWQTASFDPEEHNAYGWLGKAMDRREAFSDGSAHSVLLGNESLPIALRGRKSTAVSMENLDDLELTEQAQLAISAESAADDLLGFTRQTMQDASTMADLIQSVTSEQKEGESIYPQTTLSDRLKTIAQLIKADFSTPVYYAIQPGYDTHADQLPAHFRLLRELSGGVKAFLDDLESAGLSDRVLVMCFSEFGRRVNENASLGTDHGTAGPVFVAGSQVQAGLIGKAPSMTDLVDGDLKMEIDFRQVYASILSHWLSVDDSANLGEDFTALPLFG